MKREIFKTKKDMNTRIAELKEKGYRRIENAFWVEHWTNNRETIILERDF